MTDCLTRCGRIVFRGERTVWLHGGAKSDFAAMVPLVHALQARFGRLDYFFTTEDAAIREMADIAAKVNNRTENIGARRLHTILERVLAKLSFRAPEMTDKEFVVTADYVREQLHDICEDEDLSRFIL